MTKISVSFCFLGITFTTAIFSYLFFDLEKSKSGSIQQIFSFPLTLPRLITKPVYPNPPGIFTSQLSTAPGKGARFSLKIDFNTHHYAELSLNGTKVLRIEKAETKNKAYYFQSINNPVEIFPGQYQLTPKGEFLPLKDIGRINQPVSGADTVIWLVLGKEKGSEVNTTSIELTRQLTLSPRPAFLPLPFVRSIVPRLIEVKTNKGEWLLNKNIHVWK